MSTTYLGAIIVLLCLLIIIFLGTVVFLAWFLMKFYRSSQHSSSGKQREGVDFFCINHPEEYAHGTCAICEKGFCEKCLREVDKIHFCPEHFQTFINNEWVMVIEEKTTPETSTATEYIYNFKKEIWKEGIPSYVVTHYKINVEGDFVESFVHFFVRKSEVTPLSARIIQSRPNLLSTSH